MTRASFKISVLLIFFLCACNLTRPGGFASVQETDTPDGASESSECAFTWSREPLPELSREIDEALRATLPQASGRAEAYGENCINNQGDVVRFLAMETDYHVSLEVGDLNDKQANGSLLEQILDVISKFPVAETPGPQPGYVGVTFESDGEEIRLWFTQLEAQSAIESGLRGEGLFDALQAK